MVLLRVGTAAALTFCMLSANAHGQEKNELAGTIGRTFISDKGVIGANSFDTKLRSGKALTFAATYGRRVLGGPGSFLELTLEVPLAFNPDEDIHYSVNLVPGNYSSFFVAPDARLNIFAAETFSPWICFGGGFGHFSASSTLEFGGANLGNRSSTTGVLQFGAGFDIRILHVLNLRTEVRDFDSGLPPVNVNLGTGRQHNLFVGGGIVWRF